MNIDLSVIIPIYNGSKFIEKTIESIVSLNKDIKLEIILVNDCSKDNTDDICKEIINNKINNVVFKYINNDKNVGVAKSRSVGINSCIGKYLAFFDQDDTLLKGYKSFIEILDETNADFLSANYYMNIKNNKLFCSYNSNNHLCDIEDIKYLRRKTLYLDNKEIKNLDINTSVWNCVYRREFIVNNNIVPRSFTSYEDDWVITIESLSKANKIYLSNDYFYCWNISKTSQSHKKKHFNNYYNNRLLLEQFVMDSILNLNLTSNEKTSLANRLKKETLVWSFYNECGREPIDYNSMKNLLSKYNNNELLFLKEYARKKEKIIIDLLIKKQFKLAVFIQNNVFKSYFH